MIEPLSKGEASQIYEQRLLVFLETEPQSNKYNQVYLNPERFKAVSRNIGSFIDEETREGYQTKEVTVSDEEYPLPDLQSIYTPNPNTQ